MKTLVCLLCLAVALSGCSTIELKDPKSGVEMKNTAFLAKTAFKTIVFSGGEGATAYRRTISGFSSDQVEAIQAMTDLINSAGAAGAKAAAKP